MIGIFKKWQVKYFFVHKIVLKAILVFCLSDTGSSCHVTVMGSLIVLVNKRADWNVPVSYIKYMSSCSACGFSIKKTSKVNTILKVVIFKNYVILFRCSMICRWPEPWNFKTKSMVHYFWYLRPSLKATLNIFDRCHVGVLFTFQK
jgi:hypothetical protein